MLRFDKLVKQITFDDKESCVRESLRPINDPRFNLDKPALTIITLKTRKELTEHLYPHIEYFHKHRSTKRPQLSPGNIFKDDIEFLLANKNLEIYRSRDKQATYNTIDYVFEQFHRGVFVQIMNNKIETFVAIDSVESEGFDLMRHVKFDPEKFKDMDDFIKQADAEHFRRFTILKRKEDSIYFTNCSANLWTSEANLSEVEVDWIYINQYNILTELLEARKIGDVEFMLNFKDQTMLVKDGETCPHFHILGNLTTPLKKKYKHFIPILNSLA